MSRRVWVLEAKTKRGAWRVYAVFATKRAAERDIMAKFSGYRVVPYEPKETP